MSRVPLKHDARKPVRDVRLREGQGSGVARADRAPARYCEAEGCGIATFLRKPYCASHVGMNPHAAALGTDAAETAAREIDAAKAERKRHSRKSRRKS